MPRVILQELNTWLDDLAHIQAPGCLGQRARGRARGSLAAVSDQVLPPRQAVAVELEAHGASASQRAASFLALPEARLEILPAHSSSQVSSSPSVRSSFFLGFSKPKCKDGDIWGDGCEKCGDTDDKCNSSDCFVWKVTGKCRERKIGEDLSGSDVKFFDWKVYWGPTRPFKETGDWLKFGTWGQIMAPGNGPSKPKSEQTPAEKANEDQWYVMYIPSNKKNVEVQHLNNRPPFPWEKEPYSSEAAQIMAEYMYGKQKGLKGLGLQLPCDKMGRIHSSEDGHFCDENQVCISAMPDDFSKRVSKKECRHWVDEVCEKADCPIDAYSCPKDPPCKPGYWKDACKEAQGQPYCISEEALKKYRGPIEVNCSATDPKIRERHGFDQCWLVEKYFSDKPYKMLSRLPGKIDRTYAPPSGWFVKWDKTALSEKQAEQWIVNGRIPEKKKAAGNSEWLKKAPKKTEA